MDLTTTTTPPDADNETPPQIHPLKSLSFTNGAFNHHHHLAPPPLTTAAKVVVTYKECQRNHAAAMGGHALDGCGEFMPSAAAADPASLKCAACGCHRNFHRRDPEEPAAVFLDFRRRAPVSLSPSPSPPPVASYYSPSAPQMLLSLRTAAAAAAPEDHPAVNPATPTAANPSGRKRFRTKFSREQKEKMHSFSEKLGWKMQRSDEGIVEEFCNEIGVGKGVLKVWMHNNKHTFGKKDIINGGNSTATTAINGGGVISSDSSGQINLPPNVVVNGRHHDMDDQHNGSSSS